MREYKAVPKATLAGIMMRKSNGDIFKLILDLRITFNLQCVSKRSVYDPSGFIRHITAAAAATTTITPNAVDALLSEFR